MAELVPVDHDPFTEQPQAAAAPSVVPVDHDPFAQSAGPRQRHSHDVPQYTRNAPTGAGWDDVARTASRFGANINDRLAEGVGRPLDAATNLINTPAALTTGQDVPAGHGIEEGIKKYFGTKGRIPEAKTWGEGITDAAGKMVGETLPFTFGAAATLPKVGAVAADAAPTVANAFKKMGHRIGQGMTAKPAASLAGESVAGAESGAMGEYLRGKAEDHGQSPLVQKGSEVVGQVAGPAAMQMLPSALAAKATSIAAPAVKRAGEYALEHVGNAIPESVRPASIDRLAKQGDEKRLDTARTAVSEKLGPALARPEARAGIGEVERLQEQIPGFNPGVARATNDPELLNTQQSLDTAATGQKLREKQQGYDESRGAIAQRLEGLVPPAEAPRTGNNVFGAQPAAPPAADAAVGAAQGRVSGIRQQIGQQRDAAEGQIREMSDTLPQVDRIEGGQVMRTAREGAQRATDAETTRLRGQIANPGQVVEITPATADAEAVTMTVGQALTRRAAINQEMRDYTSATARTTDDVRAMRRLQAERDSLDGAIENAAGTDAGLRAYADHYKNENVPNFRQGASAEVGRRDQFGYGGNRVDPEAVGKKFFNPNEESAARQFNASMGRDPAARQQMIDNALDDIRHTAVDPTTGLLKEGAVAKWVQKHERVLREVPFVGEAVNARNPDALYGQIGEMAFRQRLLEKTKVARELESISGPGKNPEIAIGAALNDHVLMRQLVNSARNDPQALAAVRRSVFDAVRKEAPDVLEKPEAFLAWMQGHERPLSVALTPQHRADLTAIARAASIQGRLGRPEGTSVVPKSIVGAIQEALGITVGSAASTARGVAQGRTSLPIEMAAQGAKFANRQAKNASDAAWEEALSNPEAARMVAAVVRNKATQPQLQKLRAYLMASGAMHAEGRDNAPRDEPQIRDFGSIDEAARAWKTGQTGDVVNIAGKKTKLYRNPNYKPPE